MAILFDKEKSMFHLYTETTSYVIMLFKEDLPVHMYYGKRLNNLDGLDFESIVTDGNIVDEKYLENYYSTGVLPQECGFFGGADQRKPMFHAQYKDGSRITCMEYAGYKIIDGKPPLEGLPSTYTEDDSEAQSLEITMTDKLTGVSIVLRYSVFEKLNAITRSATVVNNGKDDINIKSIQSMCIDFQTRDFDFIHLWGAWARERFIERVPVERTGIEIGIKSGSRTHFHSPFFALASKDATEEHGDVYGFSFVYSGNFEAGVDVDTFSGIRAYMGINSFDFNWLLEPGQSFAAPEVVMVYSGEGIGEMSRTYHKLYRTRLCRGTNRDAERPVLINNWEGTYFNFDEQKIVDIATAAKKAGIELMVLDDGWFGHRDDDTTSLGDWYVDKKKLPNGIDGLANKINDLGMKFGLWFEPEMISPDSDLYRAHPDWCLHVEGRGRSQGRHQLVLDLSRDDVCDYIIGFLTEHLSKANISYVKWDMNRDLSEVGSAKLPPERQAETGHRYILGLYRILDTITKRFPDLLLEGCAGGGGRFDAGIMCYAHQFWTSDDTDAGVRQYIQHGTSLVMPSVMMGAHVSAVPNHQTGRSTSLKTRGAVAMNGTFGYELDVTKMTDEELYEVAEQIKQFKALRNTIHKGDMYRLRSPFEGNRTVWEYVAEDGKEIVVFNLTTELIPVQNAERLKLRGLDKNASYRRKDSGKVYSGEVLESCGILLRPLGDFDSEIIVFEKC